MISNKTTLLSLAVIATCLYSGMSYAEVPKIQTPAPVIYLADNLDEKDELGWCIDTVGRGFSEKLHTHSCKPRGGDVQFSYNDESSQIISATYENKCATLLDEIKAGTTLGLLDCAADESAQQFVYDAETGNIHPKSDEALCLAAGEASKSAGPFMSRGLELVVCEETDPKLVSWLVLAE